jgi:hypothetical protein
VEGRLFRAWVLRLESTHRREWATKANETAIALLVAVFKVSVGVITVAASIITIITGRSCEGGPVPAVRGRQPGGSGWPPDPVESVGGPRAAGPPALRKVIVTPLNTEMLNSAEVRRALTPLVRRLKDLRPGTVEITGYTTVV